MDDKHRMKMRGVRKMNKSDGIKFIIQIREIKKDADEISKLADLILNGERPASNLNQIVKTIKRMYDLVKK